jgi:PHD/YefM family antitoxin component YafN of YafNO toxin-antitoxin module
MFNLSRGTTSITDFKGHTHGFIQQLKSTEAPIVLTVDGVSGLVVQSVESYQELLNRIEHLEAVQGIQEGLQEFEQGQGEAAQSALIVLRTQLAPRAGN